MTDRAPWTECHVSVMAPIVVDFPVPAGPMIDEMPASDVSA